MKPKPNENRNQNIPPMTKMTRLPIFIWPNDREERGGPGVPRLQRPQQAESDYFFAL
jgi:hypothetical protein